MVGLVGEFTSPDFDLLGTEERGESSCTKSDLQSVFFLLGGHLPWDAASSNMLPTSFGSLMSNGNQEARIQSQPLFA
jgi:hypothetical protein